MTIEPTIMELPERPYVGTRRTVTMTTLADAADRIPEIAAWLVQRGEEPAGAPFLRYHVVDMARELQVEAGWPVSHPMTGDGDVVAGALPAGRYVSAVHVGHPDQLPEVTRELLEWADREGLALDRSDSPAGDHWGARLEIFHTNPLEEPDPSRWTTELQFKLS